MMCKQFKGFSRFVLFSSFLSFSSFLGPLKSVVNNSIPRTALYGMTPLLYFKLYKQFNPKWSLYSTSGWFELYPSSRWWWWARKPWTWSFTLPCKSRAVVSTKTCFLFWLQSVLEDGKRASCDFSWSFVLWGLFGQMAAVFHLSNEVPCLS